MRPALRETTATYRGGDLERHPKANSKLGFFSDLLVRRLRPAHGIRILFGEKRHSDSDFLLVFSYNRLQNGNEILFLLGVLLVGYVATELAQQIDVIHECSSPFTKTFSYEAKESGIQEIVYGIEQRA
jgi:hypothetical protein